MKPRTTEEITQDYNQKLHTLGTLTWQLEHSIPKQIQELEEGLRQIEREYKLASKVEAKKKPETNGEAPPFENKTETQPEQPLQQ